MVRQRVVAGNWKMFKTAAESEAFVWQISGQVNEPVYLAVPFTALASAVAAASGTDLVIGAQNMHDAESGAFTGEISAGMLKASGAQFVILGHSERRHLFGESDAFVNRKVHSGLASDLQPIVCIGETNEQRKAGETFSVLEQQLKESLAEVTAEQLQDCILAYEPVWAIGTGETATPEMAQEVHAYLRGLIQELWVSLLRKV